MARCCPGVSLARNQAGEVVVLRGVHGPMPKFALVPKGADFGAPVELEYPAIVISSHAVDTESCCCAP